MAMAMAMAVLKYIFLFRITFYSQQSVFIYHLDILFFGAIFCPGNKRNIYVKLFITPKNTNGRRNGNSHKMTIPELFCSIGLDLRIFLCVCENSIKIKMKRKRAKDKNEWRGERKRESEYLLLSVSK